MAGNKLMSGVYGICDTRQPNHATAIVQQMGNSLCHYTWYSDDRFSEPNRTVHLGRVGIGIFNRAKQPLHDESGRVTLVFSGEFQRTESIRSLLRAYGPLPEELSDERLLLRSYQLLGTACFALLYGQFVCAIWDRARQEIILANDRFGLYPTYYALNDHRLIFAPEVKAVLTDDTVDRSLRDDALAEYFRLQRLLGTKTLFAGIHLLPPATILRFDMLSGKATSIRYWDFSAVKPLSATITLDEAIEEGNRLWGKAIDDVLRGDWRVGVYLSGGLDSRMIAGTVAQKHKELQTFTFGQPGCRDEYYAGKIARVVGARHHYYPYHDGCWIEEYAPMHVRLAEGFHSWLHMHGISMLGDVRNYVDVNISGLGDMLWPDSDFIPERLVAAPDNIAFTSILFDLYNRSYSWPGLTFADERTLYTEPYASRLVGLAFDSFAEELKPYARLPNAMRFSAFNLTNDFTRHLLSHVVYGRSHLEYRLPYFDLDLLGFAYGLPLELSIGRRIARGIITRHLPAVAGIPNTETDLPVSLDNGRTRTTELINRLHRRLGRIITPAAAHRPKLYADYEEWLRTDLRLWAESILFDTRTLDRGIFRRDALESLWARHLSSKELWTVGKIAAIITFEMTMRHFDL